MRMNAVVACRIGVKGLPATGYRFIFSKGQRIFTPLTNIMNMKWKNYFDENGSCLQIFKKVVDSFGNKEFL